MGKFRELEVWQLGMSLVEECYRLTRRFPDEERFCLTNQIRRAAISIPSNIAEGHCRRTVGAYKNHVSIGLGSNGELETCLEAADRLGYVPHADLVTVTKLTDSVGRMMSRLYDSLEHMKGRGT